METHVIALRDMKKRLDTLMQQLDIDGKAARIGSLEEVSSTTEFWSNAEVAQKTMQELSSLRAEVERWRSAARHIDETLELAQLDDDSLEHELDAEVETLSALVERLSLEAMLSGPYDRENTILAIHAGAGGTDSQDWGQMLERMFLRWAEQNGYKVEVLERSEGEEAGIKSVMMSIKGEFAYGYLQSEAGVHRLVRISPFDSAARRHTSFVKVEVWPDIQGDIDIDISEKDLKIETYRSSGAGGQNVQKNETAIRITHMPTGVVVAVQDQRSQAQNRERAMQVLKSRLFELERRKREQQLAALKGENVDAAWGNQIRSYVLHPYQMVKDHRTDYEVGNPQAVLDGRLNDFMEHYLRGKINGFSPSPQGIAEA
ncbi:MAG: peptide chain release factor 2 [Anaerolineae bacterium]|nr:peptide chain release factor 2 [Anaerolineae bacterium]